MSKEKPLRDEYDLKKQKEVDDKKTHDYILAGKYHEKRPNYSHQVDIAKLGADRPEVYYKKYYAVHTNEKPENVDAILFVVDVATRHLAIEFLKGQKAIDTYYAIKRIYESDSYFKPPVRLISDDGNEWKKEFKNYIKSLKIDRVVKLKGQTVGMVDTAIREVKWKLKDIVDRNLAKIERAMREGTNVPKPINYKDTLRKIAHEWNKRVPIKEYELKEGDTLEKVKHKIWQERHNYGNTETVNPIMKRQKNTKIEPGPKAKPLARPQYKKNNNTEPLLRLGTIVKRKLYRSERTGGDVRFRSGDFKWSQENYKITNIYLTPGSAPMYELQEVDQNYKPQYKKGRKIYKTEPMTRTPVRYDEVKPIAAIRKDQDEVVETEEESD